MARTGEEDEAERARVDAVYRLRILDTPTEPEFDAIVREAADALGTPMAVLSLIDERRQWHKARIGVPCTDADRASTFCTHTIRSAAMFVVQDAAGDPRFADNPFVRGDPQIRFYAGTTLTTREGHRVGTLCVMDSVARDAPSAAERDALTALAGQAIAAMEARRRRIDDG